MHNLKVVEVVQVAGGMCDCFGQYTSNLEDRIVQIFCGAVMNVGVCKDNIGNISALLTNQKLTYMSCLPQHE